MFEFEEVRTRYTESRIGSLHVHLGRFSGILLAITVSWTLGFVAMGVLIDFPLGLDGLEDLFTFLLFGVLGAWFPAAVFTSYLAGLRGDD